MEAVALHTFNARAENELSVEKGSVLKIIKFTEDTNWLKAEQNGRDGHVPASYVSMKPHEWFHGRITRLEAENILQQQNLDGTFLIRESESSPGEFSISVKFIQGVQHFKILRNKTGKYYLWVVKFNSLNELVDYHRTVNRTNQMFLRDTVPVNNNKLRAEVLWDFSARKKGELGLGKGDVIQILDKSDANWWKGQKPDGTRGVFPRNYVKELV